MQKIPFNGYYLWAYDNLFFSQYTSYDDRWEFTDVITRIKIGDITSGTKFDRVIIFKGTGKIEFHPHVQVIHCQLF